MDKNSYKVLKFFNAHSTEFYSASTINKIFPELLPKDILEILHYLRSNEYLRIISSNLYQATNKGKTYHHVRISKWLSEHIIETLALIVAFIALIVSIVALVRTF
jgi:hypothetical protein